MKYRVHLTNGVDASSALQWCFKNVGPIESGDWSYDEYIHNLTIQKYIFLFRSRVHYVEFYLKYM